MGYQFEIALSYATEDKEIVDKVYHYLRAEKIKAFFAPSPEGQAVLSGENQREAFYRIFGMEAEYAALFVSKDYVAKEVPMEEASIAFHKHNGNGKVIPVYLDGTPLPESLLDPKSTNYFRSSNAAEIAAHLASRIRSGKQPLPDSRAAPAGSVMNVQGNTAGVQFIAQTLHIGGKGNA